MKNKCIILAVVLSLLISILPCGVFAASSYTDVAGLGCEEAVELLTGLGIVKGDGDGTYRPEDTLTRAEMTVILVRAQGLEGIIDTEGAAIFDDVTNDHFAFGHITLGYHTGMINGMGDGTFAPDEPVTYAQAVKMVVCALGYEAHASRQGGYPAGFMTVASGLKILPKTGVNGNDPISRGAMAELVYNALDVDIAVEENDKVVIEKGKNLLTQSFDYTEVKGFVNATERTTLNGVAPVALQEDEVLIGANTFKVGETNIKQYLGYYVKAYYYTDSETGNRELITFRVDEEDNPVLELDSEDGITIAGSGNNFSISYYDEDGKLETVRFAAGTAFKNGGLLSTASVVDEVSGLTSGTLKLIDNDADEVYEILNIREGDTLVAGRVNSKTLEFHCTALGDESQTFTFALKAPNGQPEHVYYVYDAEGNEIDIFDIATGDIVTVYASEDGREFEIWKADKQIVGKIEEITGDGAFVINGETYKLAAGFDASAISVGSESVFYLDAAGKIAYYDPDAMVSGVGKYGVIMGISTGSDKYSYPSIKVLNENGDLEILEMEKEIEAYVGTPTSGGMYKVPVQNLVYTAPVTEADTWSLTYIADANGVMRQTISAYMLWYADNAANFTYDKTRTTTTGKFYNFPWLTDEEKSDIASRKPIYYELNADGRVKTVIVPNCPEPYNKLSLMNKSDGRTLTYNASTKSSVDETGRSFEISSSATIVNMSSQNYDEEDYKVISTMPTDRCIQHLYRLNGGASAGFVMTYQWEPKGLSNVNYIVISRVATTADGEVKIYGYKQGAPYEVTIAEDTRLTERKIYADAEGEHLITMDDPTYNLELIHKLSVKGESVKTYGILSDAYVDGNNLKPGDVIFVATDDTGKANYVERVMDKDTGIMLRVSPYIDSKDFITGGQNWFKGRVVNWESGQAEVRVSIEQNGHDRLMIPTIIDGYNSHGQAYDIISSGGTGASGAIEKSYYYNLNAAKSLWAYDYITNKVEAIDANAVDVGDIVLVQGRASAPTDFIVLQNAPFGNGRDEHFGSSINSSGSAGSGANSDEPLKITEDIVILDYEDLTELYREDFEGANGNWQAYGDGAAIVPGQHSDNGAYKANYTGRIVPELNWNGGTNEANHAWYNEMNRYSILHGHIASNASLATGMTSGVLEFDMAVSGFNLTNNRTFTIEIGRSVEGNNEKAIMLTLTPAPNGKTAYDSTDAANKNPGDQVAKLSIGSTFDEQTLTNRPFKFVIPAEKAWENATTSIAWQRYRVQIAPSFSDPENQVNIAFLVADYMDPADNESSLDDWQLVAKVCAVPISALTADYKTEDNLMWTADAINADLVAGSDGYTDSVIRFSTDGTGSGRFLVDNLTYYSIN